MSEHVPSADDKPMFTISVEVAVEQADVEKPAPEPTSSTRTSLGAKRQEEFRRRIEQERQAKQLNVVAPIDLRPEFKALAKLARNGDQRVIDAIRLLASDLSPEATLLIVPREKVALVQRFLTVGDAADPGDLPESASNQQVVAKLSLDEQAVSRFKMLFGAVNAAAATNNALAARIERFIESTQQPLPREVWETAARTPGSREGEAPADVPSASRGNAKEPNSGEQPLTTPEHVLRSAHEILRQGAASFGSAARRR